jgi:hypothetical protein
VLWVVAQVQKRVQGRVGDEPHVAAAPAVAARRPAARHELLAAKRRHAVAAVPPAHPYPRPVDKQFLILDF